MAKAQRKTQARLDRRRHRHDVAVKADKDRGRGLTKPGSQNGHKTAPTSKGKKR